MGKDSGERGLADRLRELDCRLEEYFAGRIVELDPPGFCEYAKLHYERFRRDWPEGSSHEAEAFREFLNPDVNLHIDNRREGVDMHDKYKLLYKSWAVSINYISLFIDEYGGDTMIRDGSIKLPGAEGLTLADCIMGYAYYRSGEYFDVIDDLDKTTYGSGVVIDAKLWWGNKRKISISQLLDYSYHMMWSVYRDRERVVHLNLVKGARRWAFKEVSEQVQKFSAATPWDSWEGRLKPEPAPRPLPMLVSDFDVERPQILRGKRHLPFKGWLIKHYDWALAKRAREGSGSPASDAGKLTAETHGRVHGYVLRRLVPGVQEASITEITIRTCVRDRNR